MARSVDEDELIEHWTLLGDGWTLLAGKRGPTRLGFALLLLFHLNHGRFPRGRGELPDEVVAYVAVQVKVPPSEIAFYGPALGSVSPAPNWAVVPGQRCTGD